MTTGHLAPAADAICRISDLAPSQCASTQSHNVDHRKQNCDVDSQNHPASPPFSSWHPAPLHSSNRVLRRPHPQCLATGHLSSGWIHRAPAALRWPTDSPRTHCPTRLFGTERLGDRDHPRGAGSSRARSAPSATGRDHPRRCGEQSSSTRPCLLIRLSDQRSTHPGAHTSCGARGPAVRRCSRSAVSTGCWSPLRNSSTCG